MKVGIPRNAYAVEVVKRRPDIDDSPLDAKRFKKGTDKPAPTQQDLEAAEADPFNTASVNTYDIIEGVAPRDELAQRTQEETWLGKSADRDVDMPPAMPQPDSSKTMYKDTTANATDLGIGQSAAELSVPASLMVKNPYAAVQVNPAKQTHLVNKSGTSGPTYRSRSDSMDQRAQAIEYLASPKKKVQTQLDRSKATVTMMDEVDETAAELR